MDHHEENDADAWAYRADAEFTFDNSDWLDKVRFGVRYEDYDSTTRETGYRWGSISQNWAQYDTDPLPGTDHENFVDGSALFGEFTNNIPYLQQSYGNWFHGGNAPSAFLFEDTKTFRNYTTWAQSVINVSTGSQVANGCCGWTPWNGDYSATFPANDGLGINPQNQTTTAAYAQLSFKHDKWDGNIGVRLVKTDTEGSGLLIFRSGSLSNLAPPSDIAFANGASVPATGSNSYDDVLPSLNIRYKATDNVFLRFAVGKGIARPEFAQLLPSNQINPQVGNFDNTGTCVPLPGGSNTAGNCVASYTGFSGNAELEPMESTNFDFSAEWYLNQTNSLTVALFDKEVSGFIETSLGVVVPYTNNGVTKDVTVLIPQNQGDGFVRGGELAWNGFFDFLPGWGKYFGARAAFTYVDSGGTRNSAANPYDPNQQTNSTLQDYPLEGLSRTSYNAELYYSIPAVEARLAYNWRERYLLTTAAANLNIPAFGDDYGQLDASLQWRIRESLTLGVDAVNLTHSKYKVLVDNDVPGNAGNGAGLTYHNWVDSDRRYSLFLRATF
jgi:TonB-dependent receptor